MIAVITFHGISLTDLALSAAVMAYIVDRVVRSLGLSRSAEQLRLENIDVLRRNGELEQIIVRHTDSLREQSEQIVRLERQVLALEKLDQSAVLAVLETMSANMRRHEEGAVGRSVETHRLLARIATSLEGNK